ncbi:hypothetical protein [Lysobacter gummosus]|uniref:Uncharacterized protein n=1 Tax=Lysobacter gummosus TaxID=262324 RepID=A0ABY3XF09_9GAMM|nr:hypothetical protein [Lysobacter gummosus]ALN89590.1 ATP-dependent helicase HrpA domain protein [Lysobacter gummosus]UNP30223.1 hypothetical protein MOV92_02785 [Lysobacter gummosus]
MTALHYQDGQDIRLGDSVRWGNDARGVVVVMIAEQTALPGYVAAEWAYLQRGCMIELSASGLFHYDAEGSAQDEGLVLLARAT